jgi:alpha-maltose-1-phosphate synthase
MSGQAAIYFHPDGFDTSQQKLMGRQAAGEGMLRGWIQWSGADPLTFWSDNPGHARTAAQMAQALGWRGDVSVTGPSAPDALMRTGALLLPGPDLADAAWRRRWRGDRSWSLVGITHTTASHRVNDSFAAFSTAPVQPWDALICTSRSVLATVRHVIDTQEEWLRRRTGATRFVRPKLPVIPLGVHTADFARSEAARAAWRSKLGIAADTVAFLWMGRLSFHAKAHPTPMYLALEKAAKASGRKLALILAGWFANEGQEDMFRKNAARFAPSVQLICVDARPRDVRTGIWSAADAFTLPVDNIQETFGLAPVEAMAAGLPVVVTDWDGFKDTVTHGVHGFRVPTFNPAPGAGTELAYRHATDLINYDLYAGGAGQIAGFDVDAAAQAYAALASNPDLRARMGAAGAAHAAENLDWRVVIARYKDLLEELAAIRAGSPQDIAEGQGEPVTRQDPCRLFLTYPSIVMTPDVILSPGDPTMPSIDDILAQPGNTVIADLISPPDDLKRIREAISGPMTLGALLERIAPPARARAQRGIAWLAKFGQLRISPPGGGV